MPIGSNRDSEFARAARDSFDTISNFAKDIYSALADSGREQRNILKASSESGANEERTLNAVATFDRSLQDLLTLNNNLLLQFQQLSNSVNNFVNSITGGLLTMGGAAAAAPFLFGGGDGGSELDLSEPDSTGGGGGGGGAEPSGSGSDPDLADDIADYSEGAEDVSVVFAPGSRRPDPAGMGVVNSVRNAIAETFGEGYTVRIISGMGEYGSPRHRESGGGAAIDFEIYNPDGELVPHTGSHTENLISNLARQGIQGIGFGDEYMGPNSIHADIYPRDLYTEDMGPVWGSGASEYRDLFLSEGQGVAAPEIGAPFEVGDFAIDSNPSFGREVMFPDLDTEEELPEDLDDILPDDTLEEELPEEPEDISGGDGEGFILGGADSDTLSMEEPTQDQLPPPVMNDQLQSDTPIQEPPVENFDFQQAQPVVEELYNEEPVTQPAVTPPESTPEQRQPTAAQQRSAAGQGQASEQMQTAGLSSELPQEDSTTQQYNPSRPEPSNLPFLLRNETNQERSVYG